MVSLVAKKLEISHGNLAHTWKKTKYADLGICWKRFDESYHLSFRVDILTDFIITSAY